MQYTVLPIKQRPPLALNKVGAYFCIQSIFWKPLQAAQLPSKATTRTLRHSFALHLLQQGVALHQLHQLLGHQSLNTTQCYIRLRQQCPSS